ncbi:MAG TPA: hypothetical protein DIS79_04640 [Bacteroidetes bacterium]|nr:hypothetical protein [Bacteroidota bacterium]HRK04449.1 hypothetical protein [Chlorobiota bacterium]
MIASPRNYTLTISEDTGKELSEPYIDRFECDGDLVSSSALQQRCYLLLLCFVGTLTFACGGRGSYTDESIIGAHECVVYQKYGCPSSVAKVRIHPDSSYLGVHSLLPRVIKRRGADDFTELVELAYNRGDGVQMRVWTIETEHGDVVIDNYIWPPDVVF